MSVLVARVPIYSVTRLSDRGWNALQLIEGGVAWLDWAIRDQDARYHFDDETAMVAAIQPGLHASDLMLLPRSGLLIGPAKLMELAPAEIKALVAYEAGNETTRVRTQVRKILRNFATASDLQVGVDFLAELQQQAAPLFQVITLDERIALAALAASPVPGGLGPEVQVEAASFAIDEARNPSEFIDYYGTYLDLTASASAGGLPAGSPEDRRRRVQVAVDELQPLLFCALDCPSIADPSDVRTAIAEWFMLGNRIGFSRVSAGVRQIVLDTKFGRPDFKGTADVAVSAYLDAAQALLRRQEVEAGQLGQDGATWAFTVANAVERAVLTLGADGFLTLTSYCWLSAPSTEAESSPSPPPPPGPKTNSKETT
jgi:hypothetical protein